MPIYEIDYNYKIIRYGILEVEADNVYEAEDKGEKAISELLMNIDEDADDILVFGGGIIPEEDKDSLKKQGVAEIFGPGTSTQDIIDFLKNKYPV